MQNNKLITPRKLAGFWELMPSEQSVFSLLLDKLEEVFKSNCFVPLDTPILEYSEALLAKSGGETDKQVFRFSKGDTDMCMRYDLTVPLARFVAMHINELNFPFKRYQIGKVFRGERPQRGRLRELYQCDADIIGDGELSLIADAECLSVFAKCFRSLELDVDIRISNRKILSGLFVDLKLVHLSHEILTVLDKMDKIGLEEAKKQLVDLGLSDSQCEKIIKIGQISGKIDEIVPILKDFCQNELFLTGLNELAELDGYLKMLGCENRIYDLSIIRGHDYYTGTVFEAFMTGKKEIALGGGGRFENLCSYFSEKKLPGVGMSVGITRIFDILKDKYLNQNKSEISLAIINFDETLNNCLFLMNQFRENNIKADMYYENKTFKSKMKEANRRGVNYVLIVGEDEVKSKKYALKNMETGEQESLSFEEIIEKLTKKC